MSVEQDGNVGSRGGQRVCPGVGHATYMYVYPSIRPNFSSNIWLVLTPIFRIDCLDVFLSQRIHLIALF